jgi:RNA polymerase sigma-70 factor (ECF subfamily)
MTRIKKKILRKVLETMPDRELIEFSLSGLAVPYDVLVNRYRRRVEAVSAQFLRGTDREDCIQETFLKGLVNLPKLRDPGKFGSWISVIARNICLDILKRRAPLTSMEEDRPWTSVHGLQFASSAASPLAEAIRREEHLRLRNVMEKLDVKYRRVLEMRYFDGSDYAAIAQTLKKPLGTIKSLIHRGHDKLRILMTEVPIQAESPVVN